MILGWLRALAAWIVALMLLVWRMTCRYRVENDPRPALRAAGRPYAYALLHAHQVAAVFINDEPRMGAMVSRSVDGDLLVPSLRLRRVQAVRGSTRKGGKDKGGRAALESLTRLAEQRVPVLLAVDGPRGPRNTVHRGVVDLAVRAQAVVLPTVVLPSRRWILPKTWDLFQIPKPFCTIRLIFGAPMAPPEPDATEVFRHELGERLRQLEQRWDAKDRGGLRE